MTAKLPIFGHKPNRFLWLACVLLSSEIAAAQQVVSPRQGAVSLGALNAVVLSPAEIAVLASQPVIMHLRSERGDGTIAADADMEKYRRVGRGAPKQRRSTDARSPSINFAIEIALACAPSSTDKNLSGSKPSLCGKTFAMH